MKDYPGGTRLYLRADPLDPELTALLFDAEGHRVAAFPPPTPPRNQVASPDARHRAQCENRIKTLKNGGLEEL
ncbi:hypothetical protein GCM10009628_42530 [Paeniglutamicibacter kerguelensis]|uniref:Transposase n=1 Tax=Paeniglutamicibacter kerguelensis TaxID=254788 RepID=A0ABS4XDE7_9MICC|nr:hypothetical protein [Paeniglutamicibacter kerguelensis]